MTSETRKLPRARGCDGVRRSTAALCVAWILAAAGTAFAQDPLEFEPTRPGVGGGDWGLAVTPYAWLAANSTDVGTKQLRQSFNDLASLTNVGFQARVLLRWKWLSFASDWTYAELGADQQVGPVSFSPAIRQNILDMKFGASVYDSRTPESTGGVGVWVAAGGRYWDNAVNVRVVTQPVLPGGSVTEETLVDNQAWWDPVLGMTLHFPVSPKVGFMVRTTIGGAGIGNASTYLWDAELGALFRLGPRFRIDASYRAFKYDRTDGEGDAAVNQTVSVVGPSVGLSIGIF